MTEPALSSSAQQAVLAEIRRCEESDASKFKRDFLLAVGCLVLAVALASPIAAIPLVCALAFTGKIAGSRMTDHNLTEMKQEVAKEGFLDKLKGRAARVSKLVASASCVKSTGLVLAVGAGLVSLLTAPLLHLSVVYYAGLALWSVGSLAAISLSDTHKTIARINTFAHHAAAHPAATHALAPAIEPSAPGALANVPSPTADFMGAANTRTPSVSASDVVLPAKQPDFNP